MPETTPLTADSWFASAKTMFGDFPPSSSDTRLKFFAAATATARPPTSPPVKAIRRTSGWLVSVSPISFP